MKLLGHDLESKHGRKKFMASANRWITSLLILSILTMFVGIASSILLFLGSSSPPIANQVIGAFNIVLVSIVLTLLITAWVYFEKFKDNFENSSPTENFERNSNARLRATRKVMNIPQYKEQGTEEEKEAVLANFMAQAGVPEYRSSLTDTFV